jgi:DNA polymerase-3 subunit delta'
LNVSSANSILKFLEEPNDNIIGFYVTSNKMSVLPTIRSRCQEISMFYDESFNYLKNIDKIQSLFNGIYKNKEAILYIREIAVNSFENRKEWIEFFTDVIYVFNDFYRTKSSDYGILLLRDFSDEKLVKLVLLLETILKYLQSNGNIELILDKLVIEMRNLDA